MKVLKSVLCLFTGHKLDNPSIINPICKDNYLKKCSRCGLYEAHSYLDDITITITEKEALKLKQKFEDKFPYSVEKGERG